MVDLALAKAHLRAEGIAEDALIQAYLGAAAAHVEGVTGKLLTRREAVQPVAALAGYIALWWGPEPAFAAGQGIDYLDAAGAPQTVALPRLVGDRVYPPLLAGWPVTLARSPIAVSYTAGYGAGVGQTPVPADLVQAQLMLVAHWYSNREAVNGGNIVSEMPMAVEAICRRYRAVLI